MAANLKIAELPVSAPDQIADQVKVLEKVLAEAKTGNLMTVMVVAMARDEHTLVRWSACCDLMELSSHLQRMLHITQRRLDGDFSD